MPDPQKRVYLAETLGKIARLTGKADITGILPLYEDWYEPTARRFEAQPNRALAEAYFNRHRVQILKLAAIYEAADSQSLTVTRASWERAVKTATSLEETIFSLLGTGMSGYGYQQKKAEDFFRDAGPGGASRSDFTRKFQHQPKERELWLRTLLDSDSVFEIRRGTAGRVATFYVHRDFMPDKGGDSPEAMAS